MSQKTKAQLLSDITTLFPDNTTEEISPADLRAFLTNLLDSIYNKSDDGASFPFFGYKVVSGRLSWNGSQFVRVDDANETYINTGSVVTTNADHVSIDAGSSVTKWIAHFAQLNTAFSQSFSLITDVSGDALKIYPKFGGPKIEIAHMSWQGFWALISGTGSTMTINAGSSSQITMDHGDCGNNPPWLLPRDTGWELSTANALSATQTVINLRNSSGGTFTPSTGDRVSVARLSSVATDWKAVDPSILTNGNGRIQFFGIYQ